MAVNKVIVLGHLGKDPEIRYAPNGSAVANLSLATTEKWTDKESGEKKEKTEWHRIVMFGRLAEIAGEYLKKGAQVYIEGKLQTRKWQDRDGHDRYTTEIVGFDLQMLGKPSGNREEPAQRPASTAASANGGGDFDDDIPFGPLGREYFA